MRAWWQSSTANSVARRARNSPNTRSCEQWFPEHDVPRQTSPFCNNANAAIRRSLWERQPYDETLTALEDVAWAKWAQGQGYHVSYAAHAEIIHVHNETPRGVLARYRREAMAFKRIFPEAHFSIYDFARLTLGAILSDLSHAVHQHALWRDPGSILWFRVAQFWGTYQGYRHSSPVTQQLRETFYYPRGYAQGRHAGARCRTYSVSGLSLICLRPPRPISLSPQRLIQPIQESLFFGLHRSAQRRGQLLEQLALLLRELCRDFHVYDHQLVAAMILSPQVRDALALEVKDLARLGAQPGS